MTKLTAKGAATKQRIIEGAAGVIRKVGLGDTTLDDIRMRTATSKSQLFHYFHPGATSCCLRSRSSRPTASCSTNNHTCPTSPHGSRGSDGKLPCSVATGRKAQPARWPC
jgi:Bacterial regulatory proteins, tetR family